LLTLISSILASTATSVLINSNKALFMPGQGGIADYINAQFYLNVGKKAIEQANDIKAQYEYARSNDINDTQSLDELKNLLIENAKDFDSFKKEFNEKIEAIPKENLIKPRKEIITPIMNDLPIYGSNEEIRSMYSNLLASAMDKNLFSSTRPSFVQMIKEMSPIDAVIFKSLNNSGAAANIVLMSDDKGQYLAGFQNVLILPKSSYTLEEIAASIDNLTRLNLVHFDETAIAGFDYLKFNKTPEFFEAEKMLTDFQDELRNEPKRNKDKRMYLKGSVQAQPKSYKLTTLGKNFKDICTAKITK